MPIGHFDGQDGTAFLAVPAIPALVPKGKPADSKEPVQIEKVHDRIQAIQGLTHQWGAMLLVI